MQPTGRGGRAGGRPDPREQIDGAETRACRPPCICSGWSGGGERKRPGIHFPGARGFGGRGRGGRVGGRPDPREQIDGGETKASPPSYPCSGWAGGGYALRLNTLRALPALHSRGKARGARPGLAPSVYVQRVGVRRLGLAPQHIEGAASSALAGEREGGETKASPPSYPCSGWAGGGYALRLNTLRALPALNHPTCSSFSVCRHRIVSVEPSACLRTTSTGLPGARPARPRMLIRSPSRTLS